MADTIKTVKESGGDYSSLSAWEAGQQKSIASGDREIAECYTMVDYITNYLLIEGWTVPSGAEIIIRGAAGHRFTGKLGTGYVLAGGASGGIYYTFNPAQNNVTVDGITVYGLYADATETYVLKFSPTEALNSRLLNCCVIGWTQWYALQSGVYTEENLAVVANCVVVAMNNVYSAHIGYGHYVSYNNLFVTYGTGAASTAANTGYYANRKVKNCYAYAASSDPWATGYQWPAFITCRHNNTQTRSGSTGSTALDNTNFKDVVPISDSFTGADGGALDSGKWESVYGTAPEIYGNKASSKSNYSYDVQRLKGSFDTNQWAEMDSLRLTVSSETPGSYAAINCQANGDCYFIARPLSGTTTCSLQKLVGGSISYPGDFTVNPQTFADGTPVKMRLERIGNRFFAWCNDVYIGTCTDTSSPLTGGAPGFVLATGYLNTRVGVVADNFSGGNFPDYSLPVGSALIDAGTDLSADSDYPFSTDMLGNPRSGLWDVGPLEYVDTAGQPFARRFGGVPFAGMNRNEFGRRLW